MNWNAPSGSFGLVKVQIFRENIDKLPFSVVHSDIFFHEKFALSQGQNCMKERSNAFAMY